MEKNGIPSEVFMPRGRASGGFLWNSIGAVHCPAGGSREGSCGNRMVYSDVGLGFQLLVF